MGHKAGWRMTDQFKRLQAEFRYKGFSLTAPPSSGPTMTLSPEFLNFDQWNDQKIIISVGQLLAGLPIPLVDMRIPLFYKILSHACFRRAIFLLSGDAIKIMVEFACRTAGLGSLYRKEHWNKACADLPINPTDYTVESFFANYEVKIMKLSHLAGMFVCKGNMVSQSMKGLCEMLISMTRRTILRGILMMIAGMFTLLSLRVLISLALVIIDRSILFWRVFRLVLPGNSTGLRKKKWYILLDFVRLLFFLRLILTFSSFCILLHLHIAYLKKDYKLNKNSSTLEALRSITDDVTEIDVDDSDDDNSSEREEEIPIRAKAKGKVVASKSSAKGSATKGNFKKKRKINSTTSSPTPSIPYSQ